MPTPSPIELRALSKPRPVVVGYLRGPAGDAALAAGAAEARLRNVPLVILHKLVGGEAPEAFGRGESDVDHRRVAIARLAAIAHDRVPDLAQVDVRVVTTPIAEELIVHSKTASLVVLGVTSKHASTAALFDTVPRELAHHSYSPVMVVPAATSGTEPARIICGVDRSTASIEALHWAARDAERRGVTVLAVEVAESRRGPSAAPAEVPLSDWVRMHLPPVPTTVVCATERGAPGGRLLQIAKEQHGLLVVGSQRPGHRIGRSVVRVVSAQTEVPVVIVPRRVRTPEQPFG
ncbi:MAG TPA: universal stress protein [Mycobacteriales bacterium]|nr:universal stress protein [Mycobacteriales bacterium]